MTIRLELAVPYQKSVNLCQHFLRKIIASQIHSVDLFIQLQGLEKNLTGRTLQLIVFKRKDYETLVFSKWTAKADYSGGVCVAIGQVRFIQQ